MVRRRRGRELIGVASCAVLSAVMLPERAHLAVATPGIVLVVPVLSGVVFGGLPGGLLSVVAGFIAYDYFFLPPYGTLDVGNPNEWVALGVYAVVMALVARVVAGLDEARSVSQAREVNAGHLLGLSELLLADQPVGQLGSVVVKWAQSELGAEGASLLLTGEDGLTVIASAGPPLTEELDGLRPGAHLPVHMSTPLSQEPLQALALTSLGTPVGILVLRGMPAEPTVRELLPILANHLAVAVERSQLRQLAVRSELLEEVDRLRRALMGAVSHDLRGPLASIKVASSTLLEQGTALAPEDSGELHLLIDAQVDRLTGLVNSLLDMTRIQSGSLEVRRQPQAVAELVAEALGGLGSSITGRQVDIDVPDGFPLVDVDAVLVTQVLSNLIDNANRFGPAGTPLLVSARQDYGGRALVSVSDHGPGVPPGERQAVFDRFVRFDTGGRSGLGLAIAKAFVEAHGERIWAGDAPEGGARFSFTLPLVPGSAPRAA